MMGSNNYFKKSQCTELKKKYFNKTSDNSLDLLDFSISSKRVLLKDNNKLSIRWVQHNFINRLVFNWSISLRGCEKGK